MALHLALELASVAMFLCVHGGHMLDVLHGSKQACQATSTKQSAAGRPPEAHADDSADGDEPSQASDALSCLTRLAPSRSSPGWVRGSRAQWHFQSASCIVKAYLAYLGARTALRMCVRHNSTGSDAMHMARPSWSGSGSRCACHVLMGRLHGACLSW